MGIIDWIPALSTTSVIAVVLWLSRKLIATRLTAAVRHEYDCKIEELRTNLKKSEETFKANLREKESEINALRNGALSNLTARQAVLYERRIKAVEQLWEGVNSLAGGKVVSAQMAVFKFEKAVKEAARNNQAREMFELIGASFDEKTLQNNEASKARPFVSPMAWALYSAYSSIIYQSVLQLKILQSGVDNADLIDTKNITNLVKVALPHQEEYIEKHGTGAFHYLLDELESLLLRELENILQGVELDVKSIEQASKILKEVDKLSASNNSLANSN